MFCALYSPLNQWKNSYMCSSITCTSHSILFIFFNDVFLCYLTGCREIQTTGKKLHCCRWRHHLFQIQRTKCAKEKVTQEQSVCLHNWLCLLPFFSSFGLIPTAILSLSVFCPVGSNPPSVPKHRFSKLWQLCYLRSGSAPTPNCSSIWRSILLSRYFINLHHGCQHWHSWQRGQCHLLLSPFSR